MEKQYYTFELASIYEKQGYYSKAMEIYVFLMSQNENDEKISEAVERVKSAMEKIPSDIEDKEKKVKQLCEEWIRLLLLEKRISFCKIMRKAF